MKKKILTLVCSATLLSISSIAYSAAGPYVSGNVGLVIPNNSDVTNLLPGSTVTVKPNNGLGLAGAIGYGFSNNVRLEAEVQYIKHDLDKTNVFGVDFDLDGDASSLSLLFNGYYDFKNESAFTPFISAGLGFGKTSVSDINVPGMGRISSSNDDTVFTYQLGAGVGYAVNEKVTIDGKYRYSAFSDPEFDGMTAEFSGHIIYAGIRVGF